MQRLDDFACRFLSGYGPALFLIACATGGISLAKVLYG